MFVALAVTRFAHFAATCLLFGLAAFPFYAPRRTDTPPGFAGTIRVLAILTLVTGALELLAMAGTMGDSWRSAFDPQIISSAITDTVVGQVWVARLVLAAAVVGLAWRGRKSPALLAASGVLLASIALTGHSAMPGGAIGFVHRLADAVHLLAAGWWIGGLFALVLSVKTLGSNTPFVLRRFSHIGYVAVAALIVTGGIKALILVTPLSSLWTTAYGWLLVAKIILFAGMALLALSNRLQVTPALETDVGAARLRSRLKAQVIAEFGLGILILAAVGALGAMEPLMP